MQYLHGSDRLWMPGESFSGRGESYEAEWSGTDFYAILEAHRPGHQIAHKDAVFLNDDEGIDICGGSVDVILEMQPNGQVDRHDLQWGSLISCLLSEGHNSNSPDIMEAANAYWSGTPSDDPAWEYLCRSATVVKILEDNRYVDMDLQKIMAPGEGLYPRTEALENLAKEILTEGINARRAERGLSPDSDLSHACKFASLYARILFGGELQGNWDHQCLRDHRGELLDLTAGSVGRENIEILYEQDPDFWGNPDHITSLESCLPRVSTWVDAFQQRAPEMIPAYQENLHDCEPDF